MLQFYFFTVISLLLSGLILFFNERLVERFPELRQYLSLFENLTFRLVVGLITVLMGIFSLFQNNALLIKVGETVIEQSSVFLVGDLIPGVLGVWSGAVLTANFFSQRFNLRHWLVRSFDRCMLLRVPLGALTTLAGLLHLLLPQALLL